MVRPILRATLVVLLTIGLGACATAKEKYENNPKAVLGGVLGAAAGAGLAAALGASPAGIVAAGAGGGLVGGYVGHRMDDKDKAKAAAAAQDAFEHNQSGHASSWQNPDTGNSGSVTPTRTYQLANGNYCREYKQNIEVGGEQHQAHGTACRQADGSWKIES